MNFVFYRCLALLPTIAAHLLRSVEKKFMEMGEKHLISRLYAILSAAIGRVQIFVVLLSCVGILLSYLVGVYASGSFHAASRWLGAMLACTSLVTVMQPTGSYHDMVRPAVMRVVGTFLGALISYIYLKYLPFSVVGMLLAVFVLESICMMLNIYKESRIATITLVIIMLASQIADELPPAVNASLRFFESAVGVGVGLLLKWSIEKWQEWRQRLLHMGRKDDGQSVDMDTMPLRWGHLRVVITASLGQLTGAGLSTLIGVVLPLMQVAAGSHLTSLEQGALASMSLVGIIVGSVVIGALSDRHGYLLYFRLSPAIILLGAVMAMLLHSTAGLALSLFVMGFGVGGGYSLDSDYISEIMPRRWRLFMVGVAKASSAVGNIIVAFACAYIISQHMDSTHWRGLFFLIAIMAVIMLLSSVRFAQSPGFLMAHGRIEEAERAVRYFLGSDVAMGELSARADTPLPSSSDESLLRRENIPKIIFSGLPWACEGFAVYGVGVFLPVLLMAMGLGRGASGGIEHIASSVTLSGYVNIFVAIGFALGLAFIRHNRPVRQQTWGFVLAAAGLATILAGYLLHLGHWIILAGFAIFEIFLNAGPHLMTFVIPQQIYPISDRGAGSGVAAASGKVGAAIGVFLMPLLMRWGGLTLTLAVVLALQLLGAAVTSLFGAKVMPSAKGEYEWRHDR